MRVFRPDGSEKQAKRRGVTISYRPVSEDQREVTLSLSAFLLDKIERQARSADIPLDVVVNQLLSEAINSPSKGGSPGHYNTYS